jgi:hypothetical protein
MMFNPFQFVKEKFGTPVHQLVRRDDPVTSYEAAEKIDTQKMEQVVLEAIKAFPNGCIADEVLDSLPQYSYSTVTARFSSLLRKDHIEIIGTRPGRSGRQQRIMRAV